MGFHCTAHLNNCEEVAQVQIRSSKESDKHFVQERLAQYNASYPEGSEDLSFHLEDEKGRCVGGIVASMEGRTVRLDYFWVEPTLRHKGYGSMLLDHLERAARGLGARQMEVNTYSFQTPDFYNKRGYKEFARVKTSQKDQVRHYFVKNLASTARTEWEKMLQGEAFDMCDPEILTAHDRAVRTLKNFHEVPPGHQTQLSSILGELMGVCGRNLLVNRPFHCEFGSNIKIGNDVFIHSDCILLDYGEIRIGNRVIIEAGVKISTLERSLGANDRIAYDEHGSTHYPAYARPIMLGDDVWIGTGTVICAGIAIGSNVVIGPGSVVNQNIPSNSIAYGVPCKISRKTRRDG
nr:GNAT family N-acetyltransferase [Gehongia tenuis]